MAKKTLDKKGVQHLAKLATLDVSSKEVEKYQQDLGETLKYVENLQELDTESIEPTSHVADTKNVSFADGDNNDRGLTTIEALKNAKVTAKPGQASKSGYFTTKRILGKSSEE